MGMHESGGRMSDFGHRRRGGWKHAGFTLGEVLIVMAIIAILSAVAYPSYISYITRAKRATAEGFMLEVASRQERYLLDNRGYAADIGTLGIVIPPTVSGSYTVTTTSPRGGVTTPSYRVDAAPTGVQATNDASCGTLTIIEAGVKSVSGTGGVTKCWQQ
jgi:type IV pilus assembly protein PilE